MSANLFLSGLTGLKIASLTKPITAVAAMILVEECKLRLDESIEAWLPELANRRVLKSMSSQPDDTVPALRAITVRDLLTLRLGFGSVMSMPDTYPIQKLIREYRIGGDADGVYVRMGDEPYGVIVPFGDVVAGGVVTGEIAIATHESDQLRVFHLLGKRPLFIIAQWICLNRVIFGVDLVGRSSRFR